MPAPRSAHAPGACLYAEHGNVGTIATQPGVHRHAVLLKIEAERFQSHDGMMLSSQLDPYKPFIASSWINTHDCARHGSSA